MTEWAMLLLCAFVALGATSRLTQRQAGTAALVVTTVVVAVVMFHYMSSTPTDKYIQNVDATVYLTGNPASNTGPPTTEDESGVQAATWLNTNHDPGVIADYDGGGN